MNDKFATNDRKRLHMEVSVKPIYVDLETTAALLSMSVSTVQNLGRDPGSEFPKARQLSGRRVGYLLREIEAWGESRPIADMLPPPNTGAKKPRGRVVALAYPKGVEPSDGD